VARQKIFGKIYRIVGVRVIVERVSIKLPLAADFLYGAQIRRKLVTVGESGRINEQLCWVAGLAEGQGGD
jgi:hypothetical protein